MFPQLDSPETRRRCLDIIRPALLLAPVDYLGEIRGRLAAEGIQTAAASHDTAALFDWIVRLLARQGISNHAAEVYADRHGSPSYAEITRRRTKDTRCPRLSSSCPFPVCQFLRGAGTCGTPHHRLGCIVSHVPARKGALAEAAVGLRLFVRDIADGDLVGWIDDRLAHADDGIESSVRDARMRDALIEPLINIPGTGRKVWSMILAELLLGADPDRERWVTTGASFVAVDSLVHAHLHRTGVLSRLGADHPYGPACYTPGGCADVLSALAEHIDAREFNPSFPQCFPRWVQFAIWTFCSEGGWNICNGNKIDDAIGCRQTLCPSFHACDKMVIKLYS